MWSPKVLNIYTKINESKYFFRVFIILFWTTFPSSIISFHATHTNTELHSYMHRPCWHCFHVINFFQGLLTDYLVNLALSATLLLIHILIYVQMIVNLVLHSQSLSSTYSNPQLTLILETSNTCSVLRLKKKHKGLFCPLLNPIYLNIFRTIL